MTGWLLLLLLVPSALGDAPRLQFDEDGWWGVALPLELLQDASVRKKLYSGLTTTFELEAQFKPDHERKYYAMMQIRYEIWDEVFMINRLDAGGRVGTYRFSSLEETAAWLQKDPLRIAPRAGPAAQNLICRVRLIPFSRGEGRVAEDWFAKVLRVPDAVTTGQTDSSRERVLDESQDGGGIFEVLMSKSIRRKTIRTVRWQWRLDGGG
ncbi:hypothetical protein [Acanthopleuribacter pedis]|uniref:Uncharacterized protein n=1 Tax=Acanthopleuribacter pedis TaxID=442870 RepID=A0A8J7U2A0_9BACT|nr:hypothetical protein [Acanthopleuribacter pedis]MBO1317489.1 hypothetical protein [Acanthopleuribacter pedis]